MHFLPPFRLHGHRPTAHVIIDSCGKIVGVINTQAHGTAEAERVAKQVVDVLNADFVRDGLEAVATTKSKPGYIIKNGETIPFAYPDLLGDVAA